MVIRALSTGEARADRLQTSVRQSGEFLICWSRAQTLSAFLLTVPASSDKQSIWKNIVTVLVYSQLSVQLKTLAWLTLAITSTWFKVASLPPILLHSNSAKWRRDKQLVACKQACRMNLYWQSSHNRVVFTHTVWALRAVQRERINCERWLSIVNNQLEQYELELGHKIFERQTACAQLYPELDALGFHQRPPFMETPIILQ